jgi:hypothetical protein
MLQCVGIGKLKPNVVIMGFKSNWLQSPHEDVAEYFSIIHDVFDQRCGVGILRLKEGLDCSPVKPSVTDDKLGPTVNGSASHVDGEPEAGNTMHVEIQSENDVGVKFFTGDCSDAGKEGEDNSDSEDDDDGEIEAQDKASPKESAISEEEHPAKNVSRFDHKQKRGFIDVWWLFDDGGLTLLIPYILTTKKKWSNCKLRVYMAGTKKSALDKDQRQLATLLSKFRIEYSSMTVVPDISKRPKLESQDEFDKMISDWVLNEAEGETKESHPWKISDSELMSQREKTNRHVRLRELLMQHSSDASLIVITLPMPRKGLCSAGLYMAWLETLSRDMPPMLMLRGNQENVLTYYS